MLDALRERGGVGEAKLLLVVDQFEEIFRFRRDEGGDKPADEQSVNRNEAAAFVALLLRTIRKEENGRVFVVLTMRSDFLGDCACSRACPRRSTTASSSRPGYLSTSASRPSKARRRSKGAASSPT